jgi:excisionase family DNA binding protein
MAESEELLNIEQAARFLNVSETSLRRWTNSGRLACLRVGRRRERRFRRVDLIAFMEDQPVAASSPPPLSGAPGNGYTMIAGISVPCGSHFCGLYSTTVGRIKQAVDFLLDGLRPGSVCLVAAPPDAQEAILAHIRASRPSLGDVAAGRLILADYQDSGQAQLDYWESQMRTALKAGAHSLRVVGDLRGLGAKVPLEDLLDYEARYGELIAPRFPVVTMCQYDVHAFSALALLNTLKFHGDTFRYPAERLLA